MPRRCSKKPIRPPPLPPPGLLLRVLLLAWVCFWATNTEGKHLILIECHIETVKVFLVKTYTLIIVLIRLEAKSDYLWQLIVTLEMVAKKIKAMKEKKSPGVDGISPKLLMETVKKKTVYHLQECSTCH